MGRGEKISGRKLMEKQDEEMGDMRARERRNLCGMNGFQNEY